MKDDPVATVDEEKHAQLQHDQINAAYRAGIRHCIELAEAELNWWKKANDGAVSDDLTQVDLAGLIEKMQEKKKELYC